MFDLWFVTYTKHISGSNKPKECAKSTSDQHHEIEFLKQFAKLLIKLEKGKRHFDFLNKELSKCINEKLSNFGKCEVLLAEPLSAMLGQADSVYGNRIVQTHAVFHGATIFRFNSKAQKQTIEDEAKHYLTNIIFLTSTDSKLLIKN